MSNCKYKDWIEIIKMSWFTSFQLFKITQNVSLTSTIENERSKFATELKSKERRKANSSPTRSNNGSDDGSNENGTYFYQKLVHPDIFQKAYLNQSCIYCHYHICNFRFK